MKTSLLKTMLFAAAAVVGATSASALELVTNGGFESGTTLGANSYLYNSQGATTDSWPAYGTGRQNGSSVWAPSAYQGSYVIWFQGSSGDAAQVLDFPVPGTYRLSFAYAPRSDGAGEFPHYRAVRVGANVLCYYDVAKDGAWHAVTKDFVVSAPGPQELRFYQYKWNGDCGSSIDAVSVTLLTPAEAVTDCSSWRQVRATLEAGGSVRLVKDIAQDATQVTLSGSQKVTLDLNGHTIWSNMRVCDLTGSAKLTITDSAGGGVIDGQNSDRAYSGGCVKVCARNEFVLEGGTIRNFKMTGGYSGPIYNENLVTLNGGTITNCVSTYGAAVFNAATLTMNGGTIVGCSTSSGTGGAVYQSAGTTTFNGGTIASCSSAGDGGAFYADAGTVRIYGGTFVKNHAAAYGGFGAGKVNVYVYGGYFADNTADTACPFIDGYASTIIGQLYGGVWKGASPVANNDCTCASGAVYAQGEHYLICTAFATDTDKTALTGGSYTFCPTNEIYAAADLKVADCAALTGSGTSWTVAATNAVEAGDWATVNANICAGNDIILASDMTQTFQIYPNHGKSVTLDMNGHTVSAGVDNARFFLVNNWYLTIKGEGVFDGSGHTCNEGHFAYVGHTSSASGLTIEDGVTVRNMTAQQGAAYRVYLGSLTINGGTVSNCVATTGNGGAVYTAGAFTMNGGTIVGCSASTGGSGGAIFAENGGNAYIYGGSLCDNSARYYGGAIFGQSTSTVAVYGGYFRGNRTQQANGGQFLCMDNWAQNGNVYGGVFDGYDPQTYGTDDARAIKLQNAKTQIGDLYVIGNNPRLDGTAITGGQYTFALTNAEYAATGLYDAEKAVVTGSGTAWGVKTAEPVHPSTWDELKTALVQGCDVTLTNDVTQTSDCAIFSGSQQVTLDLNGKTLAQTSTWWMFALRSANCKMTVKDSATGGKIVGSGSKVPGNGGCVSSTAGEFVLDSGTITGFKAENGGAVYSAGSVVITGGTITGCSGSNGGAVYCTGPASIYGGTIENCTASNCGGAIYDGGGSIVLVYGGTFKGNRANWGGAFATSGSCWFDIYGGVFVGNTATTSCAFFDDASASRYCYVYGGEWANGYNPFGSDDTQLISGRTCAKVGSTYVVGVTGFTSHGGELVGGSFNFAVTNAEYAASGAKVFAGSTLTGSGRSFTLAPNEGAGVEAGDWATVKSALQADLDVTLTNDVVQTYEQPDLTGSQNVTLDLNGFTIDRKDVSDNYWFMRVASANATLTITDSSEGKTGKVLGDASLSHGQMGNALRVEAGNLVINGGTFEGMYASAGGGCAYVASGATLVMNGGAIRNCQAKTSGGAVHVLSGGSFTMNGGTISGCKSTTYGGAIYNAGTFTMNGGSVLNCSASDSGGGLFVVAGSTTTIFGGAFRGNYSGTYGGAIGANTYVSFYGGCFEGNSAKSGMHFFDGANQNKYGRLFGGVWTDYNPMANDPVAGTCDCTLQGGAQVAQVGDNSVVGTGVLADGATLTEGLYTFCPTNAEYAAAGVKVAETPLAQGTSPETWAIAARKYCVCGDPACPGAEAGEEHEIRTWCVWTSTTTLPTAAGNWYLAGDVNLSGQYSPVNGVTVDLAGRTIRQTATNARVINLNANVAFTLTDSVGGGKVTGGNIAGQEDVANNGGCVFMNVAGSQFVMYGGSICGNKALTGGGIYCNVASSVKVYGGAIEGNTAAKWGGGMCLSRGAHTLRNCIIRNNTAQEYWGGAVRIDYGTVTFVDCVITNNTAANWPGISANVNALPVVTLGGATVVRDNHLIGQTAQNNLGVESGYTYSLSTDEPLTAGAQIGVTADAGAAIVTTPNDGDYTALFFADNEAYAVVNDANQVRLVATNSVVATIGETRYSSLQYAFNNAGPGETITLVRNTTENVVADSYTDATLDLNGFVLKASGGTALSLSENARLVLTNGDETVTHCFTVGSNGLWAWNDGNATGAIAYETLAARPAANAVIAVKGGCVTGSTGPGIWQGVGSEVVVNGGSVVGNGSASYLGGGLYQTTGGKAYLTLNGGRFCGNYSNQHGGGLYAHGGGDFVINGGDVTFNHAAGGQGGGTCHGQVFLNGGRISWNKTAYDGGGVRNTGSLTMTGGEIVGNEAANNGGGVYNESAFTMTGGTISNCTAKNGGAIFNGGTANVYGGRFVDNSASEHGGFCYGNTGCKTCLYGGFYSGNRTSNAATPSQLYVGSGWEKNGCLYGGVFAGCDPTDASQCNGTLVKQEPCEPQQVGDSYVVGADVAQEEGKLTGGTYTFNPANAEYAAADVAVAPWVDVTTDESGDPQTWTLTDGTSPVDAGAAAKARIKADGTCWITGTGETAETEALAAQWASVRDVRIASGVTGVGDYTFYKFSNLTNVTVSADCTKLGDGAFFRCLSLEQITFEGEIPEDRGENALVIHAGIRMEGDTPVVYAVPNVTVNGKDMTLKGSNDLETWEPVAEGDEKNYHFFKFVAGE